MVGRGRPRLRSSTSGRGTRYDILQAAAHLFCERGMAASTREIAERAGIRQATLYHHFANREAILLTLLLATVQPTLRVAESLQDRPEPAPARLWALAHWDAEQLALEEVNLGALYLLPEVRLDEFADFRRDWNALRGHYATLIAACSTDSQASPDLVIGLVESVILSRQRSGAVPALPAEVADAAVLLATSRVPAQRTRTAGRRLLDQLPAPADPTPLDTALYETIQHR